MDLQYTTADGQTSTIKEITTMSATDPPSAPPPTQRKLLKITQAPYNAGENKTPSQNSAAIQKCYSDAKAQNADVEIPKGKYIYDKTLYHEQITVFNNGELQGSNGEIGYIMRTANCKLCGGTLSHDNQTDRGSQQWHHGIALYDCESFDIVDATIINPRAAGICVWDARNGRISGVTIEDCLADGIHHVASSDGTSGNIFERDNTVRRSGDDTISFVTYGTGAQPVHDIEVWNFRGEDNTWGRGITVLGAKNLVINGANLKRIWCFGLYVGQESGYGGAGQFSQVVMNDVKVDVCGSWTATSDTQEGLLIVGWQNTVSVELNDCIISRPKRHGVMRYHSTSNKFENNNTIFSDIPGQEIYNVPPPPGDPHQQQYEFPRRFPKFERPERRDQREENT